jgi:hypothetical protein
MAKLTCLSTGQIHDVPETTTYRDGFWVAGDTRFLDLAGDDYSLLSLIKTDTLAIAKASKLAAINTAANVALSVLTIGYPDLEVGTWDQQLTEAKLVAATPALAQPLAEGAPDPIPFLRQLATARESLGATPADRIVAQAAKILANAAAWAAASGAIVGRRLALEDAVDAAGSPEAVAAIVVEFA